MVPRYIGVDPASRLSIHTAGEERRTVLHELMHLLGFVNPITGMWGGGRCETAGAPVNHMQCVRIRCTPPPVPGKTNAVLLGCV